MSDKSCAILCCGGFNQTEKTAEMIPPMKIRPIDRCNNKANYFGKIGEDFKVFMPVRPTDNPGEVEPAPDCVDIIGIALCTKTSVDGDDIVSVARTATLCWTDLATSLGLDPLDEAAYWKHHVALAQQNIYVEFL